ncbi:MAG: hypothetical protein LBQ54_08845 [Planctomycetaceae bacterium]|nr:hypothetical protein [Planctomycetaceae bacterium]
MMRLLFWGILTVSLFPAVLSAQEFVVFEGAAGLPCSGKSVVLIAGDEEYRSEEMLTQMGRILAKHHGFTCTVLYAVNRENQEIDPLTVDNIPGLDALDTADLMVMFLRFRNLPDDQMEHIVKYFESGKPVLGIRTATHAFKIPGDRKWARYSFNSSQDQWQGGFGRRVLGETWINHHGNHKVEATRGVIAPGQEKHPIVTGCNDIFGPSDVYEVRLPLPEDSLPILLGMVLQGMNPKDPPVENGKNSPPMPILWTKSYTVDHGKPGRAVTSTIGSGLDFESAEVRRLLINSCYWLLDKQEEISAHRSVDLVGEYRPLGFGFGTFRKGFKPADVMEHKTPY